MVATAGTQQGGSLTAFAARWQDLRAVRLEEGPDGFKRSWIMLMPEGTFQHPEYGTLDFSRQQLAEYKRSFDERVLKIDVALDVNHKREEAPGWLEAVEYRPAQGETPAGLWGHVRWTPLGQQLLGDQIYRYFSPDLQPYTDEQTGKRYEKVIRGGALVNRPFLKRMAAVRLAEGKGGNVSTRPWGEVDKATLPDSAFLDSANRRLPIYEGAGPMANGRYTKRGKLNIHGLEAARGAVHGSRTGKPMSGLPTGIEARIQRLLAAHGRGGGEGEQQPMAEWGLVRAGPAHKETNMPRKQQRKDEPYRLDDELDEESDAGSEGEESFADGKAAGGKGGKKGAPPAADANADDEELLDDDENPDDEAYADPEDQQDQGDDEGAEGEAPQPPPTAKARARARRKKAPAVAAGGRQKMAEPGRDRRTFDEMRRELAETNRQLADLQAKQQQSDTKDRLARWTRGLGADRALTRVFAEAYKDLALGSGAAGAITLAEFGDERGRALAAKVDHVIELALTRGTVDLSRRGGSFDFDTPEKRATSGGVRLSEQERGERVLLETATELAEHDGKNWQDLDGAERLKYAGRAERGLNRQRQANGR